MKKLNDELLRQIAQIYVVANTPSYLFKHIKSKEIISEFASKSTVDELFNIVKNVDSKKIPTLIEIVKGYAAAVALTFKDIDEVKSAAKDIVIKRLSWIPEIFSLWEQKYIPTQTIEIKVKPNFKFSKMISSSSYTQSFETKGKATIKEKYDFGKEDNVNYSSLNLNGGR